MASISADDGYLTVFNIFDTDTPYGQEQLVEAMREVIDNADYPGWVSSTVHGGQDRLGTANYIQFHSREQLEERWGAPWREVYGMTESGIDLSSPFDDAAAVGSGSLGGPVPTKRVRVVDPADPEATARKIAALVPTGNVIEWRKVMDLGS
jgi:hypothetical protein